MHNNLHIMIDSFLDKTRDLAKKFNWQVEEYEQDGEIIQMAKIHNDPLYVRIFWILDPEYETLKALVLSGVTVEIEERDKVLELCARVNENLIFGCLEFRFEERMLVVRDSIEIKIDTLDDEIERLTLRVFHLAKKYSIAIRQTLSGISPEKAVLSAERTERNENIDE